MEPDESKIVTYVIYEHPDDYPEGYVLRQWFSVAGETQPGTAHRAASLEEARTFLPEGVERIELDDPNPKIIESYI